MDKTEDQQIEILRGMGLDSKFILETPGLKVGVAKMCCARFLKGRA